MQQRWSRWLTIAAAVCILGVGAWLTQQPPQYNSFPDAIRGDLATLGVAVQQVELIHQWPDTVNDVNYGANLHITLVSGADHWGRLDCRTWRRDCVYTVAALDVHMQALPDLVKQLPWYVRLWQSVQQFL